MTSNSKKRTFTEYSQTVQEVPLKKLRLHQAAVKESAKLSFNHCTEEQDVYNVLLQFENDLPVDTEGINYSIKVLLDQMGVAKDNVIRSKAMHVLQKLVKLLTTDVNAVSQELIKYMNTEGSSRVRVQILRTLCTCGTLQPQNKNMVQTILNLCIQYLTHHSGLVRRACLEVIGTLTPMSQVNDTPALSLTLKNFMIDPDPLVRCAALEALLQWQQRGLPLDDSIYDSACLTVNDDYEGVRLALCCLLWTLAQLHPNKLVDASGCEGQKARLVDSAFARLCDLLNDTSVRVRTEAAKLLGSLHAVSPDYLEQTLDKKLMSNLRVKLSASDRQRELYEGGGWASGRKWANDAPREDVDEEEISLMNLGACGAFVHGLEDEFKDVRAATVDSVCELAIRSARFATQCQDYLVDMFNDEIESVRLKAIYSLVRIGDKIELREDQMDIIVCCIKEYSDSIREGLRQLFASARMATRGCLNQCVSSLLDNLKRYPQDKEDIWRCMCSIGQKQSYFTLSILPELLSLHPYFESIEPETEDPAYVAVLLLVFNAAPQCPTMTPMFLEHTIRHYRYLRDVKPDLVPHIDLPGCFPATPMSKSTSGELQVILGRLQRLSEASPSNALQLITMSIRDLDRLALLQPSLAANAGLLSTFLLCQKLMCTLLQSSSGVESPQEFKDNILQQVILLTHCIEQTYCDISMDDLGHIVQLRLIAQSSLLLSVLSSVPATARQAALFLLQSVSYVHSFLQANNMPITAFTESLLNNMSEIEQCQPALTYKVLRKSLTLFKPMSLTVGSDVKRCEATITEPIENPDSVLSFMSGLLGGVHLKAAIDHLHDPSELRIKVSYPDGQVHYIKPRSSDVKEKSPSQHQLDTTVLLSHGPWTDASCVVISLAIHYVRRICFGKESPTSMRDFKMEAHVDISNSVKVAVQPKACKQR